jgi:hypothetical protein
MQYLGFKDMGFVNSWKVLFNQPILWTATAYNKSLPIYRLRIKQSSFVVLSTLSNLPSRRIRNAGTSASPERVCLELLQHVAGVNALQMMEVLLAC